METCRQNTQPNMRKQIPATNTNLDLTNVDHVPSSGTRSGSNAMLCQEPAELLCIGCLTGLILIQKIQIRYIDTKHQPADTLTQGNFTRDEWNNLLHLFNISHFSSTCCAKNFSLISCPNTMAKRMQEQKGEERSVAKSKSTATNLSSTVPTSPSSEKSPIASKSPGILIAQEKPEAG